MAESRPKRWVKACDAARAAFGDLQGKLEALQAAMQDIEAIKSEYEEWKDNLPENLQGSALGEKLEEICGLELEFDSSASLDEMEEALDAAEAVELPRGFGRD